MFRTFRRSGRDWIQHDDAGPCNACRMFPRPMRLRGFYLYANVLAGTLCVLLGIIVAFMGYWQDAAMLFGFALLSALTFWFLLTKTRDYEPER